MVNHLPPSISLSIYLIYLSTKYLNKVIVTVSQNGALAAALVGSLLAASRAAAVVTRSDEGVQRRHVNQESSRVHRNPRVAQAGRSRGHVVEGTKDPAPLARSAWPQR